MKIEIKQEILIDNISQLVLPNLARYYNSTSNDYSASNKCFQPISTLNSNLMKFQILNALNKSTQNVNMLNRTNATSFNQNYQRIQNISQMMSLQTLSQNQNIQNARLISTLNSFFQNNIPEHSASNLLRTTEKIFDSKIIFQNLQQEISPHILNFLDENKAKFENRNNLLDLANLNKRFLNLAQLGLLTKDFDISTDTCPKSTTINNSSSIGHYGIKKVANLWEHINSASIPSLNYYHNCI